MQSQSTEQGLGNDLQRKYERLKELVQRMRSVVLGLSGGVDSTLLARVAHDVLGDRALAVIGESGTLPEREKHEAVRLAESIGIRYRVVRTEETDEVKFRENPPDRCYYCKTELFGKLQEIARLEGYERIADGTNLDDVGDFRPGMRALREQQVRSPLREAGLTKADVRALSKYLGLPTWDKPAFACLSSRFPYGTPIDPEKLQQVEQAEQILWDLGLRNMRVRHHDSVARIEVDHDNLGKFLNPELRRKVVGALKTIGFTYVTLDLEGFRSGSMNEALDVHEIARFRG